MDLSESQRLTTVHQFAQLNFDKKKELNDLVKLAAYISKVPITMLSLTENYDLVFGQLPVELSPEQKEMLATISRQIINLVEFERSTALIEERNAELLVLKEKTLESQRKLRAFFNSSASCHTLIGRDLAVLDFNKATTAFVKTVHHKQIKVGKSILNYMDPIFHQVFSDAIKRAFEGKRTHKEIQIPDGKGYTWWDISINPVIDEKGEINSVAYHATNINDRKVYEDQILLKNKSLHEIAYIQSHHYRRPVSSILGIMELIREDNYLPPKEYFQLMEEAIKELDETIRTVVSRTSEFSAN